MTTAPVRHQVGLPPHDVSAEEAVLAALLLDDDAVHRVEGLTPEEFFRDQNGWIFAACLEVARRGEEVTIPTVAHELDRAGRLDEAGGEPFLVEVAGKYFTAVGVETHARIVARDALYRRMITAASTIAGLAYKAPADPGMVLAEADQLLRDLWPSAVGTLTAEDVSRMVSEGLLDDARPVLPTFLRPLDHALAGGLGIGELTVIAAPTSVGKTALAARIVREQTLHSVPVGVVLVEGRHTKFMHRMAAVSAGTSFAYARRNGWGPGEEESYWDAYHGLGLSHLHFAEPVPRTPTGIEQWMRQKARRDGVKHFVIDHIDRVNFDSKMQAPAAYRDALTRWGNLAGEEQVVVTVLSQVNRGVEWHPTLSQLRESGAKEELAQVVMLLSQGDHKGYSNATRHEHIRAFASALWQQRSGVVLNVEVAKFTEGEVGYVQHSTGGPAFYVDSVSGACMVRGE